MSGTAQPETIDRAVALGCFDTVQATWNLHERAAGEALGRAHGAGMEVIVKEALANGRLTPRVRNAALERAASDAGATVDAVALAVVLAQPFADVVLSGAATEDALAGNLSAARLEPPGDTLEELEEDSEEYWSRRSALPWN